MGDAARFLGLGLFLAAAFLPLPPARPFLAGGEAGAGEASRLGLAARLGDGERLGDAARLPFLAGLLLPAFLPPFLPPLGLAAAGAL